ncbi:MAG TPA: hypothetical protein ACFYEC_04135, partial [Candidatus Brocadiaceae bacterium]
MLHYVFTWLCGGMAFRAVALTHKMLKPENFMNRPLFLHKNRVVPILVTIAFYGVLAASALLGWHHSGIFGVVLRPVQVFLASIALDLCFKCFSRRLQYSFFLNPIVHLYMLPWIFIVGV